MKLALITRQTPTKVIQSVCSLESITAADFAHLHRDSQAILAFQAAVELERIPFHIYELERSVLLALPVSGGVQ